MSKTVLTILAVAACGEAPPRPPQPLTHTSPARTGTWTYRLVVAGMASHARRTRFELALEPTTATLTVSDDTFEQVGEHDAIGTTLPDLERGTWLPSTTTSYSGPRRDVGGAVEIGLTAPGGDPIALRCDDRRVVVAPAGARRVPDPSFDSECGNRGVFDPPPTIHVTAFVCARREAEPTEPAEPPDYFYTLKAFAPAPRLEGAYENDDCYLQGGGLRVAR